MSPTETAEALFAAFASSDADRVRSLCAPDLKARQNNGPLLDLETLLAFSGSVNQVVSDFRYEEPIRSATDTGFVEEHYVRGTLPDGSALDLAVCVVVDLRDGKVVSLREYVDAAAAAGLLAALSEGS
jgi:ketosteroid isomerase-like protein